MPTDSSSYKVSSDKETTASLIFVLIILFPFGMIRVFGILWEDVGLELTKRFVTWQRHRREKRDANR